jgi:hypothetical protein
MSFPHLLTQEWLKEIKSALVAQRRYVAVTPDLYFCVNRPLRWRGRRWAWLLVFRRACARVEIPPGVSFAQVKADLPQRQQIAHPRRKNVGLYASVSERFPGLRSFLRHARVCLQSDGTREHTALHNIVQSWTASVRGRYKNVDISQPALDVRVRLHT